MLCLDGEESIILLKMVNSRPGVQRNALDLGDKKKKIESTNYWFEKLIFFDKKYK